MATNSDSLGDLTSDDPRTALIALRDLLAGRIRGAEAKDTAPLARQLAEVYKALAGLPSAEEKSHLDDLASRRAARRAGSPDDPSEEVKRGSGGS